MIEIRKTRKNPDYYLDMITMSLDTLRRKYEEADNGDIIFYGYLYQEKKCFGLDYNDLIKFFAYIFEQNEAVRLKWQKRLEYIMIDEKVSGTSTRSVQSDGGGAVRPPRESVYRWDPDQTIYTWRGPTCGICWSLRGRFRR